ncbi:MAG TPA: dipeptide ABC transporter ATP-binding protein [Chroococcales cyanobacterium]|jgi:oligopeptide transport system ATP-binding protein
MTNKLTEPPFLEVHKLSKHFPVTRGLFLPRQVGALKAVDGVSFSIKRGETLGLVGESGCGKSTTGRLILRLLEATSGQVRFEEKKVFSLDRREMKNFRKEAQIVFQNPYASLDPRMTVGEAIAEPLRIHRTHSGKGLENRVNELLERVGLVSLDGKRYPHEFSGGQRQRVGIARALAISPKFLVADEPVSALDVSIQAQILNLLDDLKKEFGLTYLFISHNLSTVQHISDRIAVMYLGRIVELAPSLALHSSPKHPYTQALISAIPVPNPASKRERILLQGDLPSPLNPPAGCHFHTRCPKALAVCKEIDPPMLDLEGAHSVACHLYSEAAPREIEKCQ